MRLWPVSCRCPSETCSLNPLRRCWFVLPTCFFPNPDQACNKAGKVSVPDCSVTALMVWRVSTPGVHGFHLFSYLCATNLGHCMTFSRRIRPVYLPGLLILLSGWLLSVDTVSSQERVMQADGRDSLELATPAADTTRLDTTRLDTVSRDTLSRDTVPP